MRMDTDRTVSAGVHMRMDTDKWTVSAGVHIGSDHIFRRQNSHDAVAFNVVNNTIVGIVCDGCGEGKHSEVGANLAAQWIKNYIARFLLIDIDGLHPEIMLDRLFVYTEEFIRNLARSNYPYPLEEKELKQYINDYMLFTILGVIVTPKETVIFNCGDGIFTALETTDDEETIDQINQQDAPHYIAYRLVPEKYITDKSVIPQKFEIRSFDTTKLNRIMIATDGFNNHKTERIQRYNEQTKSNLPLTLVGDQWGKKGQTGLQCWLNAKSDKGYFADDCALVTIERKS